MTALPVPSAEAMARDPNACPVCGMWHSKECLRRWSPRTADELRALVREWQVETRSYGAMDREAFGAWLEGRNR